MRPEVGEEQTLVPRANARSIHVPTVCAVVRFNVPATKPAPVAVHVIFDAGSVRTPERRSSLASTDSRTVAFSVVRALTVMTSGPGVPGTGGTRSGLLSGKLTPVLDSDKRARPLMDTFRVAVRVWASALRADDTTVSASATRTTWVASLTVAGMVQGNRHSGIT